MPPQYRWLAYYHDLLASRLERRLAEQFSFAANDNGGSDGNSLRQDQAARNN